MVNSKLQNELGLAFALVQAPMAGGPTTPELVASVAAAGALGSFGFAYSTPAQIHTQGQLLQRECTQRGLKDDCGWNANFFVFPEVLEPAASDVVKAKKHLQPLLQRVSIDTDALQSKTSLPDLYLQVEAALQYKPSLVSFHLGIPTAEIVDLVHQAGSLVAMSATCVEEAIIVQDAKADFIVAQGIEAGGHRGIFDTNAVDKQLSIASLVAELTEHCTLPVIASGGIMNGADIVKMRSVGADAVQMGSAFLTVDECGSSDCYRAAIKQIGDRDTKITRGFSGRPARGISNLLIDASEKTEDVLAFPLQNSLTGAIRKAAAAKGDFELMSLWAGVNYSAARNCTAAQLIADLVRETKAAQV